MMELGDGAVAFGSAHCMPLTRRRRARRRQKPATDMLANTGFTDVALYIKAHERLLMAMAFAAHLSASSLPDIITAQHAH